MKIKVRPEDFIVEEIIGVPVEKKGKFGLYRLKKRGENTRELLHKLSQKLNIPFENFSYGARKDRHALTSQYLSINANRKQLNLKEDNFSLEFVGWLDKPMSPGFIKGNQFKITVRDLSVPELNLALEQIKITDNFGFANYFDDQRFGSFDHPGGFLAEKIIKKHFNGALKIYLTHGSSQDSREDKARKDLFFKNWGDWQVCLERAQTQFEKVAFTHLLKKPKDFISLVQKISHDDLSLFFSSFQAYIWNEVLRRLIKAKINSGLHVYKGIIADYIFYTKFENEEYQYLQDLTIPLPASNIKITDVAIDKIYREVLAERDLKPAWFNIKKIRQAYFKPIERKIIAVPEELSFKSYGDELYKGKNKLELNFFLPRGSFGTMFIKRIFS